MKDAWQGGKEGVPGLDGSGIEGLVPAGIPALLWALDGSRILWASPAAADLARALTVDEAGSVSPRLPALPRLRALGAGAAPRDAARIELLRLDPSGLVPLATCDCRRVTLPDGAEVLLTVITGPIPRVTPAPRAEPVHAPTVEAIQNVAESPSGADPDPESTAAEVPSEPVLDPEHATAEAPAEIAANPVAATAGASSEPPAGHGAAAAEQPIEAALDGDSAADASAANLVPEDVRDSSSEGGGLQEQLDLPHEPQAAPENSGKAGAVDTSLPQPTVSEGDSPLPDEGGLQGTQAPSAAQGTVGQADHDPAGSPEATSQADAGPAATQEIAPERESRGESENQLAASADARESPDPVPARPAVPADPLSRLRALGRVRFVWRTDQEGRFLEVSPPLGAVVGRSSAAIVGRRWDELIGDLVDDPSGIVAELFARGETWSGRTVHWRLAGTDHAVATEIGGLPVFGPGRRIQGFRGFGLLRTDLIAPRAWATPLAQQESPPNALPAGDLASEEARSEPGALNDSAGAIAAVEQDPHAQLGGSEEPSGAAPLSDGAVDTHADESGKDAPANVAHRDASDGVQADAIHQDPPDAPPDDGSRQDLPEDPPADVPFEHVEAGSLADASHEGYAEPSHAAVDLPDHGQERPARTQPTLTPPPPVNDDAAPQEPEGSAMVEHSGQQGADGGAAVPSDQHGAEDGTATSLDQPEVGNLAAARLGQPEGTASEEAGTTGRAGHGPSAPSGVALTDGEGGHGLDRTADAAFASVQGRVGASLGTAPQVPLRAAGTATPGAGLSHSERNAFREIARALGARLAEENGTATALPDTLPATEEETPVLQEPAASDAAAPVDAGPAEAPPSLGSVSPEVSDAPAAQETTAAPDALGEPVEAIPTTEPADGDVPVETAPAAEAAASDAFVQEMPEPEEPARPDPTHEAPQEAAAPEPAEEAIQEADASAPGTEAVGLTAGPMPPTQREEGVAAPDGLGAVALLDGLPVGVLVYRGETALFANRLLLDLLDFEDLPAFVAAGGVARLFRGRSGALARAELEPRGPVTIATREGESVAAEIRLSIISWDGMPANLALVRRLPEGDPTFRLRALELDLRSRDARVRELSAILDTATDGVVVVDDAGRILSLNRSAEALFGYEQSEMVGEPILALLATESHVAAIDYLEGLRSGGVATLLNDGREVIGRVRQGGLIPLFMTMGRVSEGAERKFCAVLRDITAFKKAEGELIAAKSAAEAASAQKSDFLAKVSHEIRTPLNAIIGFAEVMIEERFGAVGNERYKDYVKDIHASGTHVISLVNDLLDLAKIEAGRMEMSPTSVALNDVVGPCVALLQPQAARERIVLRTSFAAKLPLVVADERAVRQIVLNLLSNALRFTDAGGQVIVSTALTDRGEVVFRVRDTGIGMTETEMKAALEPFRQLATSRRGGGTGLGLPLTKALVEANRGALQISSAKNEGTLVEVVFPPTRVPAE